MFEYRQNNRLSGPIGFIFKKLLKPTFVKFYHSPFYSKVIILFIIVAAVLLQLKLIRAVDPIALSSVSVDNISSNSARVNFTTNVAADSITVYYSKWVTGTAPTYASNQSLTGADLNAGAHSVTLSNLAEGTVYDFKITATKAGDPDANFSRLSNLIWDPSAESGAISNLINISSGGTVTADAAEHQSGSYSWHWDPTLNGKKMLWGTQGNASRLINVSAYEPSSYYIFSVYVKSGDANTTTTYLGYRSFSDANTAVATNYAGGACSISTASWTRCEYAFNPSQTNIVYIAPFLESTYAGTNHVYADAAMLEVDSSSRAASTYFDGSTTMGKWESTTNYSTSVYPTFTTTAVDAAPSISAVAVSSITSTGATVTWTTDQPANGRVDYGTTTAVSGGNEIEDEDGDVRKTSHSVALTGLTAGTTYYFKVTSTNSQGTDIYVTTENLIKAGDFETIESYKDPWAEIPPYTSTKNNDTNVLSYANNEGETPTWAALSPNNPPNRRYGQSAVYDGADDNRLVVFGGRDSFELNDLWVLTSADGTGGTPAWSQLYPDLNGVTTFPTARHGHSAVLHQDADKMIVFGGANGTTGYNDVWVLSNADGADGTPSWEQLSPTGTAPVARQQQGAVYDETNNLLILFGGKNYTGGAWVYYNDVWILSNADGTGGAPAWTEVTDTSPPSARAASAVSYDSANRKLMVYGGYSGSAYLHDYYVLPLAADFLTGTWTSDLDPSGGEHFYKDGATTTDISYLLSGAVPVYDSSANKLFLFGGLSTSYYSNDVLVITNANNSAAPSITKLSTSGTKPRQRYTSSAFYSTRTGGNNKIIVFGGTKATTIERDETNPLSYWNINTDSSRTTVDSNETAPKFGSKSLRVFYEHGNSYDRLLTGYAITNTKMTYMPVSASTAYTFSVWVKASSGTPDFALGINWMKSNSSSSDITPYSDSSAFTLNTSWKRYAFSATSPSDATNAQLYVSNATSSATDKIIYVDGIQFADSSVLSSGDRTSLHTVQPTDYGFYWDPAGESFDDSYRHGRNYGSANGIRATFNTSGAFTSTITAIENVDNNGSVKISWTTSAATTSSTIDYGLTTEYGSSTTITDSPAATSHSATITGLHRVPQVYKNVSTNYDVASQSSNKVSMMSDKATAYSFQITSTGDTGSSITTSSFDSSFLRNIMVANPQNTSVQLLVKTASNSTVTVDYGLTNAYGSQATSSTPATIHKITISGLTASNTYYYKMTATNSSATTKKDVIENTFKTKPASGSSFTIGLISDLQGWDASYSFKKLDDWNPDLILSGSDFIDSIAWRISRELSENSTTDDSDYRTENDQPATTQNIVDELQAYFDEMKKFTDHGVFAFQEGNHGDWGSCMGTAGCNNATANNQELILPQDSSDGAAMNYSFDYGDAHIVSLSSYSCNITDTDGACYTWLTNDLDTTTKKWKIVITHMPIRGWASGWSNTLHTNDWSIYHDLFKSKGVNLVLTGHEHLYNRFLKDGIYYIVAPSASGMSAVTAHANDGTGGNDGSGDLMGSGTLNNSYANISSSIFGGVIKLSVTPSQITGEVNTFNSTTASTPYETFYINPSSFSNSSPSAGSWQTDNTPDLTWGASTNTTAGMSKYQVYIDGTLVKDDINTSTTTYTPETPLSDGTHSWYVQAFDNVAAFNSDVDIGRTKSSATEVKIDTVAPTTSVSITPSSPDGANGYYTSSAPRLSLTGTDATSGVAKTYYKWDSSSYAEYSSVLTAPNGVHTLYYYSTDNAGNSESPKSLEVKVQLNLGSSSSGATSGTGSATTTATPTPSPTQTSTESPLVVTVTSIISQDNKSTPTDNTTPIKITGDEKITITGTAAPGSTITFTINPGNITKTITVGADGKWTFEIDPKALNLSPGNYTVTAVVTDPSGKKNAPLTISQFILEKFPAKSPSEKSKIRSFLPYGVIILAVLVIIIFVIILMKRRRKKQYQTKTDLTANQSP